MPLLGDFDRIEITRNEGRDLWNDVHLNPCTNFIKLYHLELETLTFSRCPIIMSGLLHWAQL